MRCIECGYASPNFIGRFCPGCGSDKLRNDADLSSFHRPVDKPVDNFATLS